MHLSDHPSVMMISFCILLLEDFAASNMPDRHLCLLGLVFTAIRHLSASFLVRTTASRPRDLGLIFFHVNLHQSWLSSSNLLTAYLDHSYSAF